MGRIIDPNSPTDSGGRTLYVVMDKDLSTVVKSPGLDEPYHTTMYEAAEQVACEVGGVVKTLREAIKLVAKNPKNHRN